MLNLGNISHLRQKSKESSAHMLTGIMPTLAVTTEYEDSFKYFLILLLRHHVQMEL